MALINAASFEAIGPWEYDPTIEVGTVEVTLRGKTRRVEARNTQTVGLFAFGLVGRYQSGGKLWPATVRQFIDADGNVREVVNFGRDDRCSKFRKENNIWFAPEVK